MAKDLSQRELAAAADVWQPRIAELVRGRPVTITVDVLERLAHALGAEPGTLLRRVHKGK